MCAHVVVVTRAEVVALATVRYANCDPLNIRVGLSCRGLTFPEAHWFRALKVPPDGQSCRALDLVVARARHPRTPSFTEPTIITRDSSRKDPPGNANQRKKDEGGLEFKEGETQREMAVDLADP